MQTPIITKHAIQRYQERVMDVPYDVARAVLERVTCKAVEFGADTVILGSGHRVKLQENRVTTVLPKQEKVKRNGIRNSNFDGTIPGKYPTNFPPS